MNPIKIENKVGKVRLDDVVTKGLIDPLIDKIATLYGDDSVRNGTDLERLEIEIDSEGGSVQQGYRLFKTLVALRENGVEVVANITNLAASMGSVIAMAATKIRISSRAVMMIHDASLATNGNAEKLSEAAKTLDQISDEIAGIYSARTGIPAENIRNAMKAETYLSAAGAVNYGFADEVYEEEEKPRNPSILERLIGNHAPKETPKGVDFSPILQFGNDDQTLDQEPTNEMFKTSNALKAELETAQSKIEFLESEVTASQSRVSELETQVGESAQNIAAMNEEITNLSGELEKAQARVFELEGKLAETEEQVEQAGKSAAAQATQALASIGVDAINTIESAPEESEKSIISKFKAMKPGPERSAFYAKHKKILSPFS